MPEWSNYVKLSLGQLGKIGQLCIKILRLVTNLRDWVFSKVELEVGTILLYWIVYSNDRYDGFAESKMVYKCLPLKTKKLR